MPRRSSTPCVSRRAVVAALVASAAACLPGHASADTVSWLGGSGNFSSSNWLPHNPNPGDSVVIAVPASSVAIDVSPSLNSLSLSANTSATILNAQSPSIGAGGISNNGLLSIDSTGSDTYLNFNNTIISGAGQISLVSSTRNAFLAPVGSASTLTNQSTINGYGIVGLNNGNGTLINHGLIDANVNGQGLAIEMTATNTGTMQASNGGILAIYGFTVTNTNGLIQALNNSQVDLLAGAGITGGTLSTSGSGFFNVPNSNTALISGNITNLGNFRISGPTSDTYLYFDNTTISGAGQISLVSGSRNALLAPVGSASTLTNQSTINGYGAIGLNNGNGTLINRGLIDANVSGQGLAIELTTTNNATMQASNGGSLLLYGAAVTNTNGLIQALDNSQVDLLAGARITGGTLSTSGSGFFSVVNGNTAFIDGSIAFNAKFLISSNGSDTYLDFNNTTISGTGQLSLINSNRNALLAPVGSSSSLTNQSTINGAGIIGLNDGNGTLINKGLIDANVSGQGLAIELTTTNNATMQASNGGSLLLYGAAVTNTNGLIQALDNSQVDLAGNSGIHGGTLSTSGSGFFNVLNGNTAFIIGNITNLGNFRISGPTSDTYLYFDNTTISGAGQISLVSGSRSALLAPVGSASTLTNQSTINGYGAIGLNNGNGTLINRGLIDANVSAQGLYIELTTTNSTTMQASNGGSLLLYGAAVTNTNGLIQALDNSQVDLLAGARITGGTLSTSGSGFFSVVNGNTAFIDGSIAFNAKFLISSNGSDTYLDFNNTTISGTGQLSLINSNRNALLAPVGSSSSLTNQSTINGSGIIGLNDGNGTLINKGLIDANVSGQGLAIELTTTNNATMQASNGGSLLLYGAAVTNTNGLIQALDNSQVDLAGNSGIHGGTLSTSGSGFFNVLNGNTAFIIGNITNLGNFRISGPTSDTYLYFDNTTISGAGQISLVSGSRSALLAPVGSSSTLTNQSTINGYGAIGLNNGNGTLINRGLVDANVSAQGLFIELTTINNATMQATSGGTLFLYQVNLTSTGTFRADGGSINSLSGICTLSGTIEAVNGGSIVFTQAAVNISSPVNIGAASLIKFDGASQFATTLSGTGTLEVSGTLTSDAVSVSGSWTINGTHRLRAGRGNATTTKVSTIPTINGQLDLTDAKFIVQSDPLIANDKSTKIATLNAYISTGSANTWTGNGITSSTVAANAAHYGVGLFDNAILQKTSFGGQPTDTNSVLITIAHLGDANDDGIVNIQDVSIVANNWQKSRNNWAQGDLNRDGIVNIQDFSIVANNWQQTSNFSQSASPLAGLTGAADVPEPASLLLAGLGGFMFMRRRPRRNQ